MRENAIRKLWADDKPALIGWLGIPSSVSAELMAREGWDCICLDMQHGAIDYTDALPMLQAISTTDATPMIRLEGNDPARIGKLLDAGAYGVICPMINTAAQAAAFLRACHYEPKGNRSIGPLRAALYAGADYVKHANETILALPMIETSEALANLEEILSVPGLEAIYVGPSDLAASMGYSSGFDPEFPEVYEAILHIAARCRHHGVVAGIHVGSVDYGQRMIAAGYRLLAYRSDFRLLQWISSRALAAMRRGTPDPAVP